MKTYPGHPYPLGASYDGEGVNFALYSDNAEAVELCLFDPGDPDKETARIQIKERSHRIWHVYIPDLKPGQLYAYRLKGDYNPGKGHRFNEHKLLIDPYAKALSDIVKWDDSVFGYQIGHEEEDLSFNESDSAAFVPRSVIVDDNFDWEGDRRLKIPYHETIIYEMHVKGFSQLNEKIPEELRGTYSGLAHPASIEYLKELGINAVELMPVHHYLNDRNLIDKGLTNYWGYNTIAFFAPHIQYSEGKTSNSQVKEFKEMVKQLHKAGIEVILDVVYNHTAEGNHMGPTLSFRGIDNSGYYRLEEDRRYYTDSTGTGNTLDANLTNVLRLIMDSLRYWITEMHIDGFRFDEASSLARELHEVNMLGTFFDIIYQDPVISETKLIAEPWDVGEGGYQVGKFPPGWSEWNGKYRDCIRDYWRGKESTLAEFSTRFTGSSDLYEDDYRKPTASINFITVHDGFTLNDLVSYNDKHNEANKEDNQDGADENRSWNCGEEGPTENPDIIHCRNKQKRNFLTTLLLSQGVPMLLSGDEAGRTQNGNNNAYCQDNEISWIDWNNTDTELLEFTRKLIRLRKNHPVFQRRKWFQGQKIKGNNLMDIKWFLPEGTEMQDEQWEKDYARSLAVFLNGEGLRSENQKGEKLVDDSFYIMFNASEEDIDFKQPGPELDMRWCKILDTAENYIEEPDGTIGKEENINVKAHSMAVLQHQKN